MVKITNGISVFEVTEGAFESIYSKQGFDKVDEEKKVNVTVKNEHAKGNEKSEDEKFLETIVEKPIGQWTKDETAKFVELNDIDTDGATKLSEVKEIVKEFLADAE